MQDTHSPLRQSIPTNPNEVPLYGGLSGATLDCDVYHFGNGITLSKTYAHLMAPFLLAFRRPPSPSQPHPAPWRAAPGGFAFDIESELHIPRDFNPSEWFDRLNTAWWFTALIRLRATPLIRLPIISSTPFAFLSDSAGAQLWNIETASHQLIPVHRPSTSIATDALDWISTHCYSAAALMRDHQSFNTALQAFDQCIWTLSPALALIQLWGALERLFTTVRHKKTFQLATRISAYLETADAERSALANKIRDLYDARSSCAHGTPSEDGDPLYDTYELARRVLTHIIETNHVPSDDELQGLGPV